MKGSRRVIALTAASTCAGWLCACGSASDTASAGASTVGGVLIDRLQHRRLLILYISLTTMGLGYLLVGLACELSRFYRGRRCGNPPAALDIKFRLCGARDLG